MRLSRRTFLALASALPLAAQKPLNILVSGGHPGDPECGCAGTIARLTSLGHNVTLLYLNRGEGFCKVDPPAPCAPVRTAEAEKACAILKARAVFASQRDGQAIIDNQHYDELARQVAAAKPDIIFAQWPLDRHRDHRALSALVVDAWLRAAKTSALYFYEVAEDTMLFSPSDFVDISQVESIRHAACYAHASQEPAKWYPKQVAITRFRGIQSGFTQAEAFLRHPESKPLLGFLQ